MPRGRPNKPRPNLNQMADAAQAALEKMYDDGYEDEVTTVREFLVAQGKHFVETQKTNREMLRELSSRIPT